MADDTSNRAEADRSQPIKSRSRSPTGRPKKMISIRLDDDVIAAFRASGDGWQGRMNEALRKAAKV